MSTPSVTPSSPANRCAYLRSDGRRCRNRTQPGQQHCWFHQGSNYLIHGARTLVAYSGNLDTAEGIHNLLARTARALARGRIHPRRATAMAFLAQTMLKSLAFLRDEREEVFFADAEDALKERARASFALEWEINQKAARDISEQLKQETARRLRDTYRALMDGDLDAALRANDLAPCPAPSPDATIPAQNPVQCAAQSSPRARPASSPAADAPASRAQRLSGES
jgi:hypothetical protein